MSVVMQKSGAVGQTFVGRSATRYVPDANGFVTVNEADVIDMLAFGFTQSATGIANRSNLTATADPAVTDDSASDYGAGSLWINTTALPNRIWRCVSAGVGVAVWVLESGQDHVQYNTSAASNATLGAGLLTPSVLGKKIVVLRATANGANALTTRTPAQLIADIPNAQIGSTYLLRILAAGDNTVTLTAGVGVTITGTATIATGKSRDFQVTLTSASVVTFQDMGAGTT